MGWHRPGPPHIVGRYRQRIGSIEASPGAIPRVDIGWVPAPEVVRANGTFRPGHFNTQIGRYRPVCERSSRSLLHSILIASDSGRTSRVIVVRPRPEGMETIGEGPDEVLRACRVGEMTVSGQVDAAWPDTR